MQRDDRVHEAPRCAVVIVITVEQAIQRYRLDAPAITRLERGLVGKTARRLVNGSIGYLSSDIEAALGLTVPRASE